MNKEVSYIVIPEPFTRSLEDEPDRVIGGVVRRLCEFAFEGRIPTEANQSDSAVSRKAWKILHESLQDIPSLALSLSGFTPPTLEQVRDYCLRENLRVDPERFFRSCNERHWVSNGEILRGWKSELLAWDARETELEERRGTHPSPTSEEAREEVHDLLRWAREVGDYKAGGKGKDGFSNEKAVPTGNG